MLKAVNSEEIKVEEKAAVKEVEAVKEECKETLEAVKAAKDTLSESKQAMPADSLQAIGHVSVPGSGAGKGTTVKK